MATGGPPATKGKQEDFRHSCSLCMEPYRGRTPKLLPCYHTFCLPCLTALEASVRSTKREALTDDMGQEGKEAQEEPLPQAGETQEPEQSGRTSATSDDSTAMTDVSAGQEDTDKAMTDVNAGQEDTDKAMTDVSASQEDTDKASFPCPTCRAPVPIPEGGVAALQTNFYVDHDPDPDDDLSSALCDMCEKSKQQEATHTCTECTMNLCRPCRRCHDMVARDHHVTSIGLGQPAGEKREKTGSCLIHQDQILCFHCRQCDVSICLHCKLTSHEGHDTVDVASAAVQAREEISSLIPVVQHQLQVVESSIQQANRKDQELTRHVQEVTQQIHARCDTLMTWARQSRDRLLEEVSAKEASARSRLHAEKASSTLTWDTLSSLLSRAARATAADPDVVMWRKELKAAVLPQDKLDQHQRQADSRSHVRDWRYDVTDALVLHEDDVRAYMGRVAEGGDDEAGRVPVSLRELANRVEGWMKEVREKTDTLSTHLNSCSDDVGELQKKGDELQKKGDELEKKGDELERKTALLEKEITTSRKTEADLQKITESLKEKFGQARQLFYASEVNKDKTKRYSPMIFDTTKINDGNHYNTQTGIFTAPQAGLYFFTATVENAEKDTTVYAHIMVGGEVHCAIQGGYDGASGCVLVPLTAGQTVWLEVISSVEDYGSIGEYSNFSGTLVLPSL